MGLRNTAATELLLQETGRSGRDILEFQVHSPERPTCRNGRRRPHSSQIGQELGLRVSRSLRDRLPEETGAGDWGELRHLGVRAPEAVVTSLQGPGNVPGALPSGL